MCVAASHSITLRSPLAIVVVLPCTQFSFVSFVSDSLVLTSSLCLCCLNTVISVQPFTVLLRLFCPVFTALFLTRYANFVYLGFRRLLAYLHLSAASPPKQALLLVGSVYVRILSSLSV